MRNIQMATNNTSPGPRTKTGPVFQIANGGFARMWLRLWSNEGEIVRSYKMKTHRKILLCAAKCLQSSGIG